MTKKESKIVMVNGIPVTPASAAEHKSLAKRIKKKYEKLRKQYREVHGKKVDWISHWIEEGILFFSVRFTDGKCFSVAYSLQVVLENVDFSDASTGDLVILKNYYRRKDR
jgi:hypothetical protein